MNVKTSKLRLLLQNTAFFQFLILFFLSACMGILLFKFLSIYHWSPSFLAQKKHETFLLSLTQYIWPPLWDPFANEGRGLPRLLLNPPLVDLIWWAFSTYDSACNFMAATGILGAFVLGSRWSTTQLQSTVSGAMSALFYSFVIVEAVSPVMSVNTDSLALLIVLALVPWLVSLIATGNLKNQKQPLFAVAVTLCALTLTAGLQAGLFFSILVLGYALLMQKKSLQNAAYLLSILLAAALTAFYWLPLVIDGSKTGFILGAEWRQGGAPFWNYHQWILLPHNLSFVAALMLSLLAVGILPKLKMLLTMGFVAVSIFAVMQNKSFSLNIIGLSSLSTVGAILSARGISYILDHLHWQPSTGASASRITITSPWFITTIGALSTFVLWPQLSPSVTALSPVVSAVNKQTESKVLPPVEKIKGRSDMNCLWTGPMGFQCNIFAIHKSSFRFLMTDYPSWQLTLDGKTQAPEREQPSDAFMVHLPPGPHSLQWKLMDSTARATGKWISLSAIFFIMAAAILRAFFQKPQPKLKPT